MKSKIFNQPDNNKKYFDKYKKLWKSVDTYMNRNRPDQSIYLAFLRFEKPDPDLIDSVDFEDEFTDLLKFKMQLDNTCHGRHRHTV